MKQPAVFLDRDGTLNEDTGYVRRAEDVKLLTGSGEAVKLLNDAGFKVILVTNQSGVARGLMTTDDVDAVNQRLAELLAESDAHIDGIYYCPHLPDGSVPEFSIECDCRKPRPGLLLKAAAEMDVDLAASFMVGDSPRDIEAGKAAGTATILIDRGAPIGAGSDMARSILEAAHTILQLTGREPVPPEPKRDSPTDSIVPAPVQVPEAAPEPDEPIHCDQCGSLIAEVDVQSGRARTIDGKLLCRDCHIYYQARTTHAREVTNADLLAELKTITRTLTFEKFNVYNIFGGLSQACALGALLYTVISGNANTGLLLTVALQLMALTFFTLARK